MNVEMGEMEGVLIGEDGGKNTEMEEKFSNNIINGITIIKSHFMSFYHKYVFICVFVQYTYM